MTQLINEAKRMQQLAGLITESQLNEEKISFFHLKQVLTPFGIDKPKADQMADLRVGLKVLPQKAYRDESDVKAALGKIVKIEGDNITIKKVNDEEENYKKSDLIHLIDGGYQFESLDIDAVVNEALAKVRKQSGKLKENFLSKIKDTLTGVTKGMNEEELALYDRFKKVQKKYPRNLDLNPKKEDGDAEILYYIKDLATQKDKNTASYKNLKNNVEEQLEYYEK